jgi:hypothetical protein
MATTAVVNPKRKRRKLYGAAAASHAAKRGRGKARKRNPSSGSDYRYPNKRRAKRRGGGKRRRRNPGAAAYRYRNPESFSFDELVYITPAATAGVIGARWATKIAGPFENNEPGIKHAIALWIAGKFGGQLVGDLMGDPDKGAIAEIACLGFAGDLFLRKRFMKDSQWLRDNVYLEGDDYAYHAGDDMGADVFRDSTGATYVRTPQGWALQGAEQQMVRLPDGRVLVLDPNAGMHGTDRDLADVTVHGDDFGAVEVDGDDMGSDAELASMGYESTFGGW